MLSFGHGWILGFLFMLTIASVRLGCYHMVPSLSTSDPEAPGVAIIILLILVLGNKPCTWPSYVKVLLNCLVTWAFLLIPSFHGSDAKMAHILTFCFRNPSLKQQLFSYAILGFALSEAMGLFCLMVAFLILFAM